ncbi:hypothetical protein DFH06DRAFT_1145448 [Mycena polygramma]|nr:hypothetical protein DFH06DRAFT_1145448 [Mycena polygramma]
MLCAGLDTRIPDVFSVAPSLCQLLLTDWDLEYYSPDIQFPWDQITHFRGVFTAEAQLSVLRAAPKLVQCAITFEPPTLPPGESASVTLPLLRRLYIEKPLYLCHLTTPSLQELYCGRLDRRDTRVLLPLIHRSHCRLQKLVLMACLISSELITVLRGLPNLAYLLVEATRSTSGNTDLFGEMVITGTAQDLSQPQLSRLWHSWTGPWRPPWTVPSHGTVPFPPKSSGSPPNEDIPAATKALRDEGFNAGMLNETEFALLLRKGFFP